MLINMNGSFVCCLTLKTSVYSEQFLVFSWECSLYRIFCLRGILLTFTLTFVGYLLIEVEVLKLIATINHYHVEVDY